MKFKKKKILLGIINKEMIHDFLRELILTSILFIKSFKKIRKVKCFLLLN